MSDEHHSGLLYGLEQRIPPLPAFFSALQHVLAGLVGIITPPLIIGATLGLGDWLPYLISMSLLASGIGTFLQSNRVWGIGAGMICMQGTSFAFLGVTVAGGMWVKAQGGGPQDMMAMLFGVNFVAALVPVIVSRFIEPLKKIFTPIITGSVIALIGISLIKVSVINWCGGEKAEDFASMSNIALGAGTLGVIVLLSCAKNRWLRLSSVVVGIAVGCIAAGLSGQFHLHSLGDTLFRLPTLFPFGFQFNSAIFLPVALVSLVCILEAVGDLTANSLISQQSVDDCAFRNRLKGGILADGVSCMVAAMLCAFPNTTFAQNNGVIQMTGVASRYALLQAARKAMANWGEDELNAALSAHPRIGEKPTGSQAHAALSRQEQSSVDSENERLAQALREGNARYEARFGRVFLIRAKGRSGEEILQALTRRLQHTADEEVAEALAQLREITMLRLEGAIGE